MLCIRCDHNVKYHPIEFSILSLPTFLIFYLHLSGIIHEQVPTAQSQEQRLLPTFAQPVFYFQQIYYFPSIFLITAGKKSEPTAAEASFLRPVAYHFT